VRFRGPLTGADLDAAYAAADVVVVASRMETYGMVVTEALARGLPVIASDVGGIAQTLRDTSGGVLVPPEDPHTLGRQLRRWLTDPAWRAELRRGALARRPELAGWDRTAATVSELLAALAVEPVPGGARMPGQDADEQIGAGPSTGRRGGGCVSAAGR
jgi:glycosyltransferase involved in cell wall biosynthesis